MNYRTVFIALILLFAQSSALLSAQDQDIDTLFNESSNSLTAVPLIINNPTLKTGFGGMGRGYVFL